MKIEIKKTSCLSMEKCINVSVRTSIYMSIHIPKRIVQMSIYPVLRQERPTPKVYLCLDMYSDSRTDMCPDMCTDMYLDMCKDMRTDMCTDMCSDLCLDMDLENCTDMY